MHTGDTLLLKAGDTWNESFGLWKQSSTTISSYGSGSRPRIYTDKTALDLGTTSYVTVRGISLTSAGANYTRGIAMTGKNYNNTIDNVEVKGFQFNITAEGNQGTVKNLVIKNSQITDANGRGYSHGLFADKVQGLTLTNDDFERNGGHSSMYNHGAYVTGLCSGLTVTGCTFAYSSNFGLQARCGGTITNNTFKANSIDLSVGYVNGAGVHTDGGVYANVSNNTFTGVGIGLHTGIGMFIGNIKSGTIASNKFINGTNKRYAYPIVLARGTAAGHQVGVNNLTIKYNSASKWGGPGVKIYSDAGAHNVSVYSNSW